MRLGRVVRFAVCGIIVRVFYTLQSIETIPPSKFKLFQCRYIEKIQKEIGKGGKLHRNDDGDNDNEVSCRQAGKPAKKLP